MTTNLDIARECGAEFYAEWERNTIRFTPDQLDAFADAILAADRLARQEPSKPAIKTLPLRVAHAANNVLHEKVAELEARLARQAVRQEPANARQEPNHNTGLLAALKNLLPFVEVIQDAGPIGEGWQSDSLLIAIDDAQKAINKAEYGPAKLDGGTGK